MKKLFLTIACLSVFLTCINAQLAVNLGADRGTCGSTGIGYNSVSGGTPPYQYQWTSSPPGFNSVQPSISVNGVDTVTYFLSVTDNTGQNTTDTIRIFFHPQLNLTFPYSLDTLGCVNNIFRFQCDVTGGVPPYSFKWNFRDGTPYYDTLQSTEHVYDQVGDYEWQIDVSDAGNCGYLMIGRTNHVQENCGIFHVSKQDMACYTTCNGSAGITPQQPGVYNYLWSTGETTATIQNLCQGRYSVTVMDAQFNTIDTFATIISRPPSFNLSIYTTHVSCHGGHNGFGGCSLPDNGNSPFTYAWNNGENTRYNGQLSAGTYVVTVTDEDGCAETATTIITEPSQALLTQITSTPETVTGLCDGSITTTTTGGTPPYTYNWGAGIVTPNRTNLCEGSYTVTVRDANLCSVVDTGRVACPNNAVVTIAAQDLDCLHPIDTITSSVSGGVPPYTYLWNTGDTSNSLITNQAGIYTLVVSDATGCAKLAKDTITNLGLYLSLQSASPVSCNGILDGKIKVNTIGGTPPFSYLWNTGATTDSITGLASGNYTLTVTDAVSCSASFAYFVNQTSINWSYYVFAYGTSSNCSNNGQATASVHGGTAPFTYLWNTTPPQTTPTAVNLAGGHYSVIVTGSDGCERTGLAYVASDCYNVVTGYVYSDVNGNCIKDSGEAIMANVNVHASNGAHTYYGNSNNTGHFSINIAESGNFNVSGSISNNWGNCAVISLCNMGTTNFTGMGDTASVNIATGITPGYNININPSWTVANPGFTKRYWITYNQTTLPAYTGNSTITFQYDSVLVFQSCTNGGIHNPANRTITWTVSNVPYPTWNTSMPLPEAYFTLPATTPIGYPLAQEFWITPSDGDCDTTNNHINVIQNVNGAYDPNAKEVYPTGDIIEDDSILTYTIQFQNTGNDTTWFVILKDTLSEHLDPATVVNISSSHRYSSFGIAGTGELTWIFEPIFLTDSATNETESKGYVIFKVKKKSNLPLNTVIENKAYIYFDYNQPIITNTAQNTIVLPTYILAAGSQESIQVEAIPNPFASFTQIKVAGGNSTFDFELFDATGKSIKKVSSIDGNTYHLQRQNLSEGLYYYSITTHTKQRAFGKLIVK